MPEYDNTPKDGLNELFKRVPVPLPPSPDLGREAQEYADKINPFVWPKNGLGEDIEQRVGQHAPNSAKHRKVQKKIVTAYLDAATPREAQLQVAREALTRIIKDSAEHPAVQAIAKEALKQIG